ncbi:MAG: carbohydrate ABC transporter permease [Caldilinea sp. CFX5]|nr:carbohydrate ABC transporter permease [Caldilinea sp. CFX5]
MTQSSTMPMRTASQPERRSTVWHAWQRQPWLNYLALIVGALIMVFPFLWMLSTSFKPRSEIMIFPPTLLPKVFTFENYTNVFDQIHLAQLYWNTTYVTIVKTTLMIYTGALLGYVFGKFHFWGQTPIFYFILFTMIVPFEVYMIPLYQMMVFAQLGNTHTALVLPHIFSAYAIFLFRQFMFTIPNDLIDAARIDSAGEWYIFHRLILPLCGPVLATTISFYFMWNWNDFLWPLIVITTGAKAMLPVALAGFVAEHGTDYGIVMAGATVAVIPVLVVFLVLQRYVVQGIALTGLK